MGQPNKSTRLSEPDKLISDKLTSGRYPRLHYTRSDKRLCVYEATVPVNQYDYANQ